MNGSDLQKSKSGKLNQGKNGDKIETVVEGPKNTDQETGEAEQNHVTSYTNNGYNYPRYFLCFFIKIHVQRDDRW